MYQLYVIVNDYGLSRLILIRRNKNYFFSCPISKTSKYIHSNDESQNEVVVFTSNDFESCYPLIKLFMILTRKTNPNRSD